ncbi:3-hydroxybutyryl-CoA dehydratase [Butyrivibrio sp. Su6]|uniref:MaoC family dehydratase n=1 Tax=Butyrivibrio sp. Su6 TaxID=1520810 RepID=UPI00089F3188|nr:MaoC family dehydratase [Butyrivibrio sp. Su6]SEG16940.1 3-hydroxybutyryl-CoA dehydratase [Butyrivibrio sp. Su6]
MHLEIGMKGSISKTISESDVYTFAGISGDFNPIHIDKIKAERSIFGKQIAHGILVSGLISNVIGTKLPGEGSIYLEQNLKFMNPVYIGDTCTAEVVIIEVIKEEKGIYKLDTYVRNQNDEIVISGYAIVKYKEEMN